MTGQHDGTADEELRQAVRTVVWEPVEPVFMWLARVLTRWLL